ncbi:MAG: hypothetical protein D6689_00245 [Deltaproteobacteria bacterium]|nr:MAG: hypothetical protein D6689_00245 [Deltaproteobacteria bacterium]
MLGPGGRAPAAPSRLAHAAVEDGVGGAQRHADHAVGICIDVAREPVGVAGAREVRGEVVARLLQHAAKRRGER